MEFDFAIKNVFEWLNILFERHIMKLITENNLCEVFTTTFLATTYSINHILKYVFDYIGPYFRNSGLEIFYCFWIAIALTIDAYDFELFFFLIVSG